MLVCLGFMGGLMVSFVRILVVPVMPAFKLPRAYSSFGGKRSGLALEDKPAAALRNEARPASKPQAKVIEPKAVVEAGVPAPKVFTGPIAEEDLPVICNKTVRFPDASEADWVVIKAEDIDQEAHPCHWTNLTHWALTYYYKLPPIRMCTHDPEVDTVISSHLHKYGFWGAPDEFMVLLSMGPCTEERPYMLDIGGNIGLFTLMGAEKGCHVLTFEPLAENNHRMASSLIANGYWDRVILFKHAVGKFFTSVNIGFRPSNPGSSGINLGGSKSEKVRQITIDGLLMGDKRPSFPGWSGPPLQPSRINFIKVDTEGYDIAVIAGMLRVFLEGRVPFMLIEFGPMDAAGTAGCDPFAFVDMMYGAGYTLYEFGKPVTLKVVKEDMIPGALGGHKRRVFESWFVHNDVAHTVLKNGKLRTEN